MISALIDFFQRLFDTSGFPPRWLCGNEWTDFLGWFYISSNLLVWSAYFAIPVIIIGYLIKKRDLKFHTGYFLFAGFILSCGSTHLIDAIIFWVPVYRFNALMLFMTGVISWVTVGYLIKYAPVALTMKTATELEAEVETRKIVEDRLNQKIRQMNEAQSIAKMGSWEWDLETDKVHWSDEMFYIFELPIKHEDLIFHEDIISYVPEEDQEYLVSVIKRSVDQKHFTDFFHRILTPSGKVKVIQVRGEVHVNGEGKVTKLTGTGQDVSEQKKNEQELLSKTKELEEVNKGLQKFAYIASHDLQEPMRKIKTYLSLLDDAEKPDWHQKSKVYVEKINLAASRMQHLMNDILDFSRLASSELEFQKISLDNILQDVLGDMEVSILESNAKISIGTLPDIEGNASQWGQLFQNLIGNAIKFKKTGKRPEIEIDSEFVLGIQLKEDDQIKGNYAFKDWYKDYHWGKEKFCKLQIRDNGIGFETKYKERIFEPFQRLHNQSDYEGTGIGLAICQKIVESHNGHISADSTGNGTVFTVIVPLSQSHFQQRKTQGSQNP
ncbi:sensor histidine kinase [Pleomorphovibrio marinus]|uniref:sensor histidine kinase n=1 Tax=Pleomorphovibrio marinus TaxID=2164132 RepID=UPI000E0C7ADD|nr:ATP-binding protein [Pleomorphovibrio marinus]